MLFNHIHFIINPVSGKEEPILSYINKVFCDTGINWDVSVTKKDIDAGEIARKLIRKTDLIVVYGGDGSISEVASALHNSQTPMAILPGGTANIMAKELGIPLETLAALQFIISENCTIQSLDMGLVNHYPFLLRINLGIMADMVLHTDRELKTNLGQLAYGISALKTIVDAMPIKYILEIDGEIVEEEGVSLTVTNSGNMGISDYNLLPGINMTDGLLDVILLANANFTSLYKIAESTLFQSDTDAVKHWKCKQIKITMEQEHPYVRDDSEQLAAELNIKISPNSIKMLMPIKFNSDAQNT